ncbi:MerR family transcriptional regulator [Paenibacillus yanchengensis]
METAIKELINGIAVENGDNWLAIQKLIQLSNQQNRSTLQLSEHPFQEEDVKLWSKLPKMRGEDPDSLEWIGLLGQIKRALTSDPASPNVQHIIRRMLEKQAEQFHNKDDFLNKLWEIRKSPEQSEQYRFYPLDDDIIVYLEKAYEIYLNHLNNHTL